MAARGLAALAGGDSSARPFLELALESGPPLGLVRRVDVTAVVRLDEQYPRCGCEQECHREARQRQTGPSVTFGDNTAGRDAGRGEGDTTAAPRCKRAVLPQCAPRTDAMPDGASGGNDAGRRTSEEARSDRSEYG
jgi:hypothetical protein